jgi:hypothetical protein
LRRGQTAARENSEFHFYGYDVPANTYGYVGGNPVRYIDPTGEVGLALAIPAAAVALAVGYSIGDAARSFYDSARGIIEANEAKNMQISNAANSPADFDASRARSAETAIYNDAGVMATKSLPLVSTIKPWPSPTQQLPKTPVSMCPAK